MNEIINYDKAVETIKTAILQSQYDAACSVNEKQLMLYYGIEQKSNLELTSSKSPDVSENEIWHLQMP